MDNDTRATRALKALKEYRKSDPHAGLKTWLVDFLTDAMHLDNEMHPGRTDFLEALQTAQMHFNEEAKA